MHILQVDHQRIVLHFKVIHPLRHIVLVFLAFIATHIVLQDGQRCAETMHDALNVIGLGVIGHIVVIPEDHGAVFTEIIAKLVVFTLFVHFAVEKKSVFGIGLETAIAPIIVAVTFRCFSPKQLLCKRQRKEWRERVCTGAEKHASKECSAEERDRASAGDRALHHGERR